MQATYFPEQKWYCLLTAVMKLCTFKGYKEVAISAPYLCTWQDAHYSPDRTSVDTFPCTLPEIQYLPKAPQKLNESSQATWASAY